MSDVKSIPEFPLATRTVEQKGLNFRGTVVVVPGLTIRQADGEMYVREEQCRDIDVFVTVDDMLEVDQRTTDGYLRGDDPPQIGYHEELALLHLGLAVKETRGGIHGTEKLAVLLKDWEVV